VSGPVAEYGHALAVADAVLYEGYLLYPYRKSSGKNRVRWQFGVLAPRAWVPAESAEDTGISGSADAWRQRTECLLEAPRTASVHMRLRFLQTRHRSVQATCPDRGFRPAGELTVEGRRHLTFDEAIPREYDIEATVGQLCQAPHVVEIFAPPGEEIRPLGEKGRLVWTTWPVRAVVRLSAERADAPFPLVRLRAEIENTAGTALGPGAPRAEALRVSLIATHSLLLVRGGSFLSLLDPPAWAETAAKECRNVHTFPVLAGDAGRRDVMLSAPILMYDHPEVSPESPGALFDATEIDEILSLRTLTLTDEEKREARATDPRAAEIIDRVDGIPREVMDRLHGAVRSLRPAGAGPGEPSSPPRWWEPGADSALRPDTDAVVVDGVRVAKGTQVRLRPRRRGADAHDMFLEGRTGLVEAVFLDVENSRHVAVTLMDDPGADLHRWYGRYYYFAPDELEPIGTKP
jgi:hypothetical protein